MSPFQHGEVFVTDDGAENDLDLGHYERFVDESLSSASSFSAGQIYESVIMNERKGTYLGKTVQVIPHVTNEIKSRITRLSEDKDIVITEIADSWRYRKLAFFGSRTSTAPRSRSSKYLEHPAHLCALHQNCR